MRVTSIPGDENVRGSRFTLGFGDILEAFCNALTGCRGPRLRSRHRRRQHRKQLNTAASPAPTRSRSSQQFSATIQPSINVADGDFLYSDWMVKILTPELLRDGDDVVVTARISGTKPAGTLRYRLPAKYAPTEEAMADAMLPAGLLLAMTTDQQLELEAPVSQQLLENSDTVQDIFSSWHPKKMKRTQVSASTRTHQPQQVDKLALSTFTGGVDSFYTLDKNADKISSILFVHGFDVRLKDTELRARMSTHLKAASDTAEKTLIEGASNIRRFLNPHLTWSKISHGAVISSFVMLLSSHHDRFYFPSSYSYADQYPWGSHPLVDPLWSTEYLKVIHDGAEASRVDKTRKIADNPSAQRHLRICFQKKGDYNCGVCSKCIRTKIALELAGVLDRFETLDNTLDLDALRQLGIKSESDRIFAQENLDFARQQNRDDIAHALSDIIDVYNSRP